VKFLDKIKHYDHNTVTKTMFLTQTEQAQLRNQLKNTVDFLIDGGYPNFERGRAYINMDICDISCYQISPTSSFITLTHQNILGSLLALNIKRETIGDIIPEHSVFYIISELDSFVIQEFSSIGNSPINLEKIDGSNFIRKETFEKQKAFVDSLRLDLIVSKFANCSRTDAVLLIESELVKVNHVEVTKISKSLQENDIISIRKKGRFKLIDTQNTSRKGKIILIYGKFV